MTKPGLPASERFWMKVDKSGDCWEWTAYKLPKGYGIFNPTPKVSMLAHRFSFALHYGPFDQTLLICHRCDNPSCVRPDHLFTGTHADNIRDMCAKGRSSRQQQTHCKSGHEFTPENIYRPPGNPVRKCRTCKRDSNRERMRAKRRSHVWN